MKRRAPARLNAMHVAKLVRYLQDVPSNVTELAEAACLSAPTARRFVLAMEREGAIHVCQWETDRMGRYCTKVYAFGQGRPANKPTPRKQAPGYSTAKRRQLRVLRALAGAAA